MKNKFLYLLAAAFVLGMTGCEDKGTTTDTTPGTTTSDPTTPEEKPEDKPEDKPEEKPEAIVLETSRMEYVWDRHENRTGSYWIAFQFDGNGGVRSEINLECVSDFAQDLLQATPAVGVYEFADTNAKQTFTRYSEFIPDVARYKEHVDITAGKVTIARDEMGKYNVEMILTAGNGEGAVELTAEYKGAIYPEFLAEADADRTGLTDWDEVTVDRFNGESDMWEVVMRNSTDNTFVKLVVNTQDGLDNPPTGNFPMAEAARAGKAGTTEPASMCGFDDYDWGCWYGGKYADQKHVTVDYPSLQYGVPGKGGVEISKEGDVYTFAFSMTDPDGHTVSGSCRKEIEMVDPNNFAIAFSSAENNGSGTNPMIDFMWDGAAGGEKLTLDMYVEEGAAQTIPDGTYKFIDQYNVTGTFSSYGGLTIGTGQEQRTIAPDGGTVKFTGTGAGYRVEFNIHFEDGRTLRCTYQGAIAG